MELLKRYVESKQMPYFQTNRTKASLEARRHSIRVNAVSPGFLPTKIAESVTGKDASGMLSESTWNGYVARQGRVGHPDEIGDVVVLLSTPRMSLVNGHNLVVDGLVISDIGICNC